MQKKKTRNHKRKTPIIIGIILALAVSGFLLNLIFKPSPEEGIIKIVSAKTVFRTGENPQFVFTYNDEKDINTVVKVFDVNNKEIDNIGSEIQYDKNGEIIVNLNHNHFQQKIKPGRYKMKLEVKDGDKIYIQEQEFVWGVLVVNTNKTIYLPGEKAYLQFAVLKDNGQTICDGRLKLEIIGPDGKIETLSTEEGTINYSGRCFGDNVIDTPDYFAHYQVGGQGGISNEIN